MTRTRFSLLILSMLVCAALVLLTDQATATSSIVSTNQTAYAEVVTGYAHSCGRTVSGTVDCWGSLVYDSPWFDSAENPVVPQAVSGLSNVTALAAGNSHTCALTGAGAVMCWGKNGAGQLGNGSQIDSQTPVAVAGLAAGNVAIVAGGQHSCAINNAGAVSCWGQNLNGQLGDGNSAVVSTQPVSAALPAAAVELVAGASMTCARTASASVYCWGLTRLPQGMPASCHPNCLMPTLVPELAANVVSIVAGNEHACAQITNGTLLCWGDNSRGQLGDIDLCTQTYCEPRSVAGLPSGPLQLSAGFRHTCAVTETGDASCWGANFAAQLGNGTVIDSIEPVDVVGTAGRVSAITAGGLHSCALLDDDSVRCWGDNHVGQIGNGEPLTIRVAHDVATLEGGVVDIDAGRAHTCVALADGSAQCWGEGSSGQLGNNRNNVFPVPDTVDNLPGNAVAVATGERHSCFLIADGSVSCTGANDVGQLGDQTFLDRYAPVTVFGLSTTTEITTGDYHSCALDATGAVECWGLNNDGQVGNNTPPCAGSNICINQPVGVIGLASGNRAIAAGAKHTCAINAAGGVLCWGLNAGGQLGDGTTNTTTTPVAVSGLTAGVEAITAGREHTCALLTAGDVKCWGRNNVGQLGDDSTIDSQIPVDVVLLPDVITAIEAGAEHTCAIDGNGAAMCWGSNSLGQLGSGQLDYRTSPFDVAGMSATVSAIAAGERHTCALVGTGRPKCWGNNALGQLGAGPLTLTQLTAADVLPQRVPSLDINYPTGQSGSTFTLTGQHFPPSEMIAFAANAAPFDSIGASDGFGNFIVFVDTTGADDGYYLITATALTFEGTSAITSLQLTASEPARTQEGGGFTLMLPEEIGRTRNSVLLPTVFTR